MFVVTLMSPIIYPLQPDIIFLELIEPWDYNNVPQFKNKPVHANPMSHNLHPSFKSSSGENVADPGTMINKKCNMYVFLENNI